MYTFLYTDKIKKLLERVIPDLQIPFTVKIRLGTAENKINVLETVGELASVGVAADTIHGRTMEQVSHRIYVRFCYIHIYIY